MAKQTQAPEIGKAYSVQGFVGRMRDFDLTNDEGVVFDYAYAFSIRQSGDYIDVVLFDDARGWVEGEVFNPETGRFRKVAEPLRSGDYVRVTGRYGERTWERDGKSGTNRQIAVNIPDQLEKLARPEKRTGRVSFSDTGEAKQAPAAKGKRRPSAL